MAQENNNQIRVTHLKKRAIELADMMTEESDIRKINVTQLFWKDIHYYTIEEVVNIQLLGKPFIGKSTAGMEIGRTIQEDILRKKWELKNNLVADQISFSRLIMDDPDMFNTSVVIDEWIEMGETGENSTIESAWLRQFSDVNAQKKIHRISCSPTTIIDKNSFMILEVLATDKERKLTRCLCYVKVIKDLTEYNQLVGYVDIYVGKILENEEYQEYRRRKFKKMELITREGVRDIREMEYSDIIQEVILRLEGIATYGIVKQDIIKNTLERAVRNKGRFVTIIGIDALVRRVKGYLELVKSYTELVNKVYAMKKQINKLKTETQKKEMQREIKEIAKTINELRIIREETLEGWKHLVKVKEEYEGIEKGKESKMLEEARKVAS